MIFSSKLKYLTKDTNEFITLDDAKLFLKVDSDDEDTLVEAIRDAAIEYAENYCNRLLAPSTVRMYLDEVKDFVIPYGPVTAIDQIKYFDTDSQLVTADPSTYDVDLNNNPAKVKWLENIEASTVLLNRVQVDWSGGYIAEAGTNGTSGISAPLETVPKIIRQAILMIMGLMYEGRQDQEALKQSVADRFLHQYKIVQYTI